MPVYAAEVNANTSQNATNDNSSQNSSDVELSQNASNAVFPHMTGDEHFIIFGSSGDESLYSADEVERALERIRNGETEYIVDNNETSDEQTSVISGEDYETSDEQTSVISDDGYETSDVQLLAATVVSMTTGTEGLNLIKRWEGLRLTAYKALSTEKYYTIGYGHSGSDVYEGMTITQAQADAYLVSDVNKFETSLNNYIKKNNIALNQNQFDALVSFSYNVGTGWQSRHDMPMMLTNGQERFSEATVREYFCQWRYSGGKEIQGLLNRRNAETDVFLKACYDMCSVSRVSLDVGAQVGEILYLSLTDAVASDSGAFIRIVHGTDTIDYPISSVKTDFNNCRVQLNLPIQDATDTITAYIYDGLGNRISIRNSNTADNKGYHFSLDEYAYLLTLDTADNDKLEALVAALKAYSQCSRAYFTGIDMSSYMSGVTVDTSCDGQNVAGADVSVNTFNAYNKSVSGTVDGFEFIGNSLVLEAGTQFRYYFSLAEGHSIAEYSFAINGTTVAAIPLGGVYYIEVANIAACDIDNTFSLLVRRGNSQSMTVSAGVYSYAHTAFTKDNNSLKQLLAMMYKYNKAAEAYFG